MKYRADIDGLRAVAVSAVVLFHLSASRLLTGGYAGVDIFFVISGYLITTILVGDIEAGKYSIRAFYERRIRRIVPAYLAVVVATALVGYAILLPDDLQNFAGSAASSALFSSNIFFWLNSGDYFAAPAELKPLLHTWSLSVEEQFYLFVPPALWAIWRIGLWKWRFAICLAILLASLALSVYGARYASIASFYLLPTRAWELLAGSLLALRVIPSPNRPLWANIESLVGAGLILVSFVAFDAQTDYPSYNAVLPVAGAALVIHAGMSVKSGVVGAVLASTPFTFIGKISYSLYLWHWPIIVYSKYYLVSPLPFQAPVTLAACLLVAALSWRFIEQPFRSHRASGATLKPFLVTVAAFAVICSAGLVGYIGKGLPYRVPDNILSLANKASYLGPGRECGNSYKDRRTIDTLCILGRQGAKPSFALIGDSHANAIAAAVFEAADLEGRSGIQLTDTGYRPLTGLFKFGEPEKYAYLNQLSDQLLDTGLRDIVIAIYWHQAVAVDDYLDDQGNRIDGFTAVLDGLSTLVTKHPDKRFLIVVSTANSPLFGAGPFARAQWFGRDFVPVLPLQEFDAVRTRYQPILAELAQSENVQLIELADEMCSKDGCTGLVSGRPAYSDDNHLSYEATRLFLDRFRTFFADPRSSANQWMAPS